VVLAVAMALCLIALLDASLGHRGASGYLAVLALSGAPADQVRATALPKETAAVSAAVILMSSVAGLIGLTIQFARPPVLGSDILLFVPAVLVAGCTGARLGATKRNGLLFRRILAFVLLGAALKLGANAIA